MKNCPKVGEISPGVADMLSYDSTCKVITMQSQYKGMKKMQRMQKHLSLTQTHQYRHVNF